MAPRKAVEEELNKEKIMQVARELFVTRGYRAVSMRGIAKRLGYSHGVLYYHFKDKAELFSALVVKDFASLSERLERVLRERPAEGKPLLERVFLEYLRFGLEHKSSYEIMFMMDDSELNHYAQAEKMRAYERFAAVVMQAMREIGKSANESVMVPWSLFLSLHGFVAYYVHTDQSYEEMRGLAENHARMLARSVT